MSEYKDLNIRQVSGWEHYFISDTGKVFSTKSGIMKELATHPCRKGYLRINFTNGNYRKSYKVHRLVAEAFIPNPEGKPQVNHINSVRDDNNVDNLEWATASENTLHGVRYGDVASGEDSHAALFTNSQVLEIYNRLVAGEYARDLAKEYGTSFQSIDCIRRKTTYKYVTEGLPEVPRMSLAGENNSQAKLTNNQVVEIYTRILNGETQADLCREFNMSSGAISNIKTRKRHSHLTEHLPAIK